MTISKKDNIREHKVSNSVDSNGFVLQIGETFSLELETDPYKYNFFKLKEPLLDSINHT